MEKLIAEVYATKIIQEDHWERGCTGARMVSFNDKTQLEFTDTNDLVDGLGEWISSLTDIDKDAFVRDVQHDPEGSTEDSFWYSRTEDGDAEAKFLTESDPEGWLAEYEFTVTRVMQEVEYQFDRYESGGGMTFKEAVELMNDGVEVDVVSGGYTYNVGPSEGYVGGPDGKFMSSAMGNVYYETADWALQETLDWFKSLGQTPIIKES
jgi:hypothetical protein